MQPTNRSMFLYIFVWLGVILCDNALAQAGPDLPLGDCSDEPQLEGRSDIVVCEPWESQTWYDDHGFVADGGKRPSDPVNPALQLEYASVTSAGCYSGKCLKLLAKKGGTRSLSVHWPLAEAGLEPQELYFRYYLKLGPEWNSLQCDASGNVVWPPGGKFPGIADARVGEDTGGQCGNGGAASDGINCWSGRGTFAGCEDTGGSVNGFPYDNTCALSPGAVTRIGTYLYHAGQEYANGSNGIWDSVAEDQSMGSDYTSSCRRADPNNPPPECYCDDKTNLYCGIGGHGMLHNDRWYAIEMYVKMNTPGQADGILRGWVDGELAYEKDNLEYRYVGHDNLHARTIWLDVYKGGVDGNCNDSYVYLDNMVVATDGPIGTLESTSIPPVGPNPPTDVDGVATQ